MNKKAPFIIVISGVGGAGKNSVMEVFQKYPEKFVNFVSYTDRPIREGDIPGETYHFITQAEFSEGIEKGEFIEWEQTRGQYRYGRKKADLNKFLESGQVPFMQIDVLGMQKFKKIYNLLTFFIMPPSVEAAKARLEKRGSDSKEAIAHRFERYDLELSHKDKYDHIIINDQLENAQKEILEIIDRETKKFEKKSRLTEIIRNSCVILLLFSIIAFGFFQSYKSEKTSISKRLTTLKVEPPKDETNIAVQAPPPEIKKEPPVVVTPVVKPPSKEVKKKIAASPPKYTPPAQSVVGETKTNNDGSTTTSVSTGAGSNSADLQKIAQSDAKASTPLDIPYNDETSRFADLKPVLLNYMNSVLKWKNEIGQLKELAIRDAGASGWLGVYEGNYVRSADGSSITGSGMIVINIYYIEKEYCVGDRDFDGCEGEYAKYILAHEYGHHYTIYHKLVDWGLLPNERFPDSYYTARPLSKTATATDYSLGWQNCEAEVIAEDYSYFYSGYGLHRMSSIFGNPAVSIKNWLDNIGSPAPTLTIVAPENSASISGTVTFKIEAASTLGLDKVSFYIGDNLISAADNKSLEITIDTTAYANGTYILRAVVDNGMLSTTREVTVTINNISPAEIPPVTP